MKRVSVISLWLLLCCLGIPWPIRAATVTGNLLLITGASHPDKRITFTPDDAPRDTSAGTVLATPTTVTSANGAFTAFLGQGSYRLSIEGNVWRRICVPAGLGIYSIHSGDVDCGKVGIFLSDTNDVHRVSISSADTTAGFLEDELVAGSNITITKNGTGANETLTIAGSAAGELSPWSTNNATLQPKYLTLQTVIQSGLFLGTNSHGLYTGGLTNGESLLSYRDTTKGEPDWNEVYIGVTGSGSSDSNVGEVDATATSTYGRSYVGFIDGSRNSQGVLSIASENLSSVQLDNSDSTIGFIASSSTNGVSMLLQTTLSHGEAIWNLDSDISDANGGASFFLSLGGTKWMFIEPLISDGQTAYRFGTSFPHTSGNLLEVGNANATKAAFAYDGRLKLQGGSGLIGDNGSAITYNGTPVGAAITSWPVKFAIGAPYSLLTSDSYVASIGGTNLLPTAASAGLGKYLIVKAASSTNVLVWVNSGDFIDNLTNETLSGWSSRIYVSDGTNTWMRN